MKNMLEEKDKKLKEMSSSNGAAVTKQSDALKLLNDENKALRTQVNAMKKEVAALKKQCEAMSKQPKKQSSSDEEDEAHDEEEEAPPKPLSRQTKKNTSKRAPGRPRKNSPIEEEEEDESNSDGRCGTRDKKANGQWDQKRLSYVFNVNCCM